MWENNLNQKISSNSVCWDFQNVEEGIADNKLSKFYQEQGQCSSINEEENYKYQQERKQQEKSNQLTETQNVQHYNERSDLNKKLHQQKLTSTERQKALEEYDLDNAKNLNQIKNQQKEIMSSIIENANSTTNKRNCFSYTNLSTLQEIDESKAPNNNKIFCQGKQQNTPIIFQNSFSSLGTISEENTQKSQSSQNSIFNDRNVTNSSLRFNENQNKTDKDDSDKKDRKKQEQMRLLISCLVILALSYLYLVIVQ